MHSQSHAYLTSKLGIGSNSESGGEHHATEWNGLWPSSIQKLMGLMVRPRLFDRFQARIYDPFLLHDKISRGVYAGQVYGPTDRVAKRRNWSILCHKENVSWTYEPIGFHNKKHLLIYEPIGYRAINKILCPGICTLTAVKRLFLDLVSNRHNVWLPFEVHYEAWNLMITG